MVQNDVYHPQFGYRWHPSRMNTTVAVATPQRGHEQPLASQNLNLERGLPKKPGEVCKLPKVVTKEARGKERKVSGTKGRLRMEQKWLREKLKGELSPEGREDTRRRIALINGILKGREGAIEIMDKEWGDGLGTLFGLKRGRPEEEVDVRNKAKV